jgi:hypothetical protein
MKTFPVAGRAILPPTVAAEWAEQPARDGYARLANERTAAGLQIMSLAQAKTDLRYINRFTFAMLFYGMAKPGTLADDKAAETCCNAPGQRFCARPPLAVQHGGGSEAGAVFGASERRAPFLKQK